MVLRTLITTTLGIAALCLTGCSILDSKSSANNAAATEYTAYYTCSGCHGTKNERVDLMTPKIIGQKKNYLAAKLRDFRDHKRIHPFMNGVVSKLNDQEISNLADYYANYVAN